jgi:tetratricopeptide (TPR) repeat protein
MRTGSLEIAVILAANINESVGQGRGEAFVADANAYGQVFEARRAIWKFGPQDALKARAVLTDVVARYPRFAPALAVLAEATIYASDHPWYRGPIPLSRARPEAAHYAQRAIAAAPSFGPGYSALGTAFIETPAALPPLRRAVQLSPGSYEVQHRLARALEMAGDHEQALLHQRIAAELQPLGLQANYMLLRMLRLTGRVEEMGPLANRVINRLGPDRIAKLQFISSYSGDLTGDLSTSHRAAAELVRLRPDHEQGRRALMWAKIYLGYRRDAAGFASDPNSITALILRDDARSLISKVPGLGPDFWTLNWETYDASNYLVRKGRSDILVELYEEAQTASGGRDPGGAFVDGALVIALRNAGKNSAARRVTNQLAQTIRESGWAPVISAGQRARLLLLQGKAEPALDLLEFALRDNWWNIERSVIPFEDEVVFDGVRNHPRFKAIVREYYKNVERERRELAAEMKRHGGGTELQ